MKQSKLPNAPRLRFTDAERAAPTMKKPIQNAERAADRRDAAYDKLTKRRKVGVQRTTDAAGKPAASLSFQEEVKTPGSHRRAAGDMLVAQVHRKIDEDGSENTGVQAAHEMEKAGESSVRMTQEMVYHTQTGKVHQAQRAEKKLDQANVRVLSARDKRNRANGSSNPLSRWQQKRAIRRAYAKAKMSGQAQAIFGTGSQTVSAARKTSETFFKASSMFPVVALGLMLLLVMSSLSSCAPLAQTLVQTLAVGAYPAEEADLLAAEQAYAAMEQALQNELNQYAILHPEYDEVEVDQDEIGHDPHVLLAMVSAIIGGEWTVDSAYLVMERLFARQYEVTTSIVDMPEGGKRCIVTMTNHNLSYLAFHVMSHEQVCLYALFMSTLGHADGLFAGNPHASQLREPTLHDVPQEYLDADPEFALVMAEASKYIGYPYIWGGSAPDTSFDCSGFVSWVYTETGVCNIGRLGATGLHGFCRPVSEADARPGDLVFFEGTMGVEVGGITHVGIYVGDGWMIHCGNPISFADLSETYWQQHIAGYGRLPD